MNKISAIIIARNEAPRIKACIDALKFCDEILVIDNGSSDGTQKTSGATVFEYSGNDFAGIRNFAKNKARGEWLLYVDADETVTPQLVESIGDAITGPPASYKLRRKNFYLGKPWPGEEHMLRLFHRDTLVRWEGKLHETPIVRGDTGVLDGYLLHDTHRTLEEMVEKTNAWSDTEAGLRLAVNHPPVTWWRLLRVMWTGFSGSYFKQKGWKAGTVGIIESLYQAFSMFITYAKLYEKQEAMK